MFSRIVPLNSQVSWSTIPNVPPQVVAASSRGCRSPSTVIRPAVDLVEAHQQVDERRLAGAGGPDDGDRLARLDDQVQVLDERRVGLVAERDALERDPAGGLAPARRGVAVSGISSASSSSSKTRSAEATADWRTFMMLAVWTIGIVNWREYWMNAWTSPSDIWPAGHPHAADDRDRHVVQVGDEVHRGLDDARDELRPEAGLVEPLVLGVEAPRSPPPGGRTP